MLSDSESDAGDDVQLTINEHFAKAYAYKKEREELAKLKEKYGSEVEEDDENSDDSEEDESEDEDGEELTPAVDAAILRTLARIKRRDPAIYDNDKDVFEEEQRKTKEKEPSFLRKSAHENSKPLLMRQHKLQSALEAADSDSDSDAPELLTHTAEQAALRKETISAFHSAVASDKVDGNESTDDDLLIPREKSKDEIEREQEEYRVFLAREVGEDIGGLVTLDDEDGESSRDHDEDEEATQVEGMQNKKKTKATKSQQRKNESDHEFLMNYILNRGWIDTSQRHVPTYNEITSVRSKTKAKGEFGTGTSDGMDVDADANGGGDSIRDELDDDEEFEDVVETFETSYNFRFEEPNASTIPTHPRHLTSTVRRTDTTRKDARERRKERKEEELLKKKEEVKRMKALKMKEVRERLEMIKREGGKSVREDALEHLDLDGDWDPDAHDKQMADIYDGGDENFDTDGEFNDDFEKPDWGDEIDITDIAPPSPTVGAIASSSTDKKTKKKKKQEDEDEDEYAVAISDMDADAPPSSLKRKNTTAEEREALASLDALDFTSLAGGLHTRFKYTPVLPDSFGLTPAEILLADDAELNEYVGLRRLAPYRRDADGGKRRGLWDHGRGERLGELKRKLKEKWGDVATGFGGAEGGTEEGERPAKRRKGKKERQKEKLASAVREEGADSVEGGAREDADTQQDADGESKSSKKRRRRHRKAAQAAES